MAPTIVVLVVLLSSPGAFCAAAEQAGAGHEDLRSPQTTPSKPPLELMLDEADRLADRDPAKARTIAEGGLAQARAAGDGGHEAYALTILGNVAEHLGEYAKARNLLEQGLAILTPTGEKRWVARIEASLGRLSSFEGKHDEAKQYFQKALLDYQALGDLRHESWVLLQLGGHAKQAFDIAANIGDKRLQAAALHSLGDELFSAGDFAAAQQKTEQAGLLYQELDDNTDYARVLTSLGRLQRAHGRARNAIPYYQKALEIQKEVGDRQGQLQSLNAIGVTYGLLDDSGAQRTYFHQALKIAQETGSQRYIDFMQGGLAGNAYNAGNYAEAEATLKAIIERQADPNLNHRYYMLSLVYSAEHRYQEALLAANKAIELDDRTDFAPVLLAERSDAEIHLKQYAAAEADLRTALNSIEERRRHLVPADFMKRGYTEQYKNVFSGMIALEEQLGQSAKAFETAEQARARSLLDLLATRNVLGDKTAAPTQEAGVAPAPPVSSVEAGLTFRGASAHSSMNPGGTRSPSFASADPPTIEEVFGAATRLHSTILSYWLANDQIYIWVVQPTGNIHSARVEASIRRIAELVRAATAFNGAAPTHGQVLAARGDSIEMPATNVDAWRELYKLLIAPVRQYLPRAKGSRLTIIPYGPLNAVSFAALLAPDDRYLIEDYEIHYEPSASMAVRFGRPEASLLPNESASARFLLVGDPASRGELIDHVLPRLPGAREEVRAIAAELGNKHSTVLVGERATESAFRSAAPGKRILHLATHAIINPQAPLDSYLLLASEGGDSASGGRLTAEEIYGLNLDTDLVVLSACRTGSDFGAVEDDGVAHFARAFFSAGARSVVVTLWDVEDSASSALLKNFYRHWPGGATKSSPTQRAATKTSALRQAQLRLIRELRAGRIQAQTAAGPVTLPENPYLWAGFVLIGEP